MLIGRERNESIMSVVYMLSARTTMHLAGGRFIIEREGNRLRSLLLAEVECVIMDRRAEMTTPALCALLERGAGVFYVDRRGRLLGHTGSELTSYERLHVQYESFRQRGIDLARDIVRRKMTGQIELLRSYAKSHRVVAIAQTANELKTYRDKLAQVVTLDELRGYEGLAARKYFAAFPELLDQSLWPWTGRNRRPPRDPVNALLSYGYTLLERDVRLAIIGAHLDGSCGCLHANNGRKDSLVFDLMEPFRPVIIDRLVLRLLNLRVFHPDEFTCDAETGCLIAAAARTRLIESYEAFMERPDAHFAGLAARTWLRQEIAVWAAELYRTADVQL